ncbi:DEAD-domain-containing protein [Multifurca ochricompacta]|uniref:DEAD-domain-containing protein n=1 Tax=Multifurca ochricompacta TaxID=376703 RepID=A0AAD4QN84_9AGAM|nr:DEAD-domain-containing protein [Multifurca ochricompacta]
MAASNKRKNISPTLHPSKNRKSTHVSLDDLSWQPVVRTHTAGLDFDEGLLDLEEVDGVQVVYKQTANGRVAAFIVNARAQADEGQMNVMRFQNEVAPASHPKVTTSFNSKHLLPAWHSFALHSQLYASLYSQNIVNPTPIQAQAIPKAISGRDVVGVAETGSGKTLAYGLPILHKLLTDASASLHQIKPHRPLRALVLAPTRELALQISTHLNACLNYYDLTAISDREHNKGRQRATDKGKEECLSMPRAPPLVSVAAIVGGMSTQKQKRILERGVDVLVATPGRLWDLLEGDDELAENVKNLQFLVLDEADRMVETGHFAELDNILRLTQRRSRQVVTDQEFHLEPSIASSGLANSSPALQTFVFSATLSKELQHNLKRRWRPKGVKKNNTLASTLDDLLLRLDFRDPDPEVIDISPASGVVSTLKESRIECLATDKDIYLYYFLLRYPGRTLVFLSSVDGIRRLTPLLELLGLPTFPLHSQLEQHQRLKNLDRFKSLPHSILLATDIAARGLDIPSVSHVIHYQVPRTVDTYIHRTGRTARAQRIGFSLLMCAPDERRVARALFGNLGRQVTDIPEMNVEHYFSDKLKRRVRVAKAIDTIQHRANKATHERTWMRATAKALDIELDSDCQSDDHHGVPKKRKSEARDTRLGRLKAELKELLKQPLVARGVSMRYITSGSRPIAHDIVAGENHEGMLGVRKTDVWTDSAPRKEGKVIMAMERSCIEFEEEWTGIRL